MSKAIKTILVISIAIFGAGVLFIPSTWAQVPQVKFGDKNIFVDFDGLPFDLSNWAPGASTPLKTITITNDETFNIDIYIGASRTSSEPESGKADLADVLTLTIEGQSKHISELFTENIKLSSVGFKNFQAYNLFMSFDEDAGNEYQNKTIDFDFVITIKEVGKDDGEIPPVIIPGGGGGGGVFIAGLEIYDEVASGIGENSVTITWRTNLNSTSRVIYSPYGLPHLFNPNDPPNYGYVFSTIEDSAKVTGHTVHITGLLPATTYYFRCISHTSPDETITIEHTFTTKGVAGEETEKEEDKEAPSEGPGEWIEPEEEDIPEEEIGPIVEEEITEEKEEPIVILAPEVISGFLPNLLADIGDIFEGLGSTCYNCFPLWVILILAVYPLIESALSQRREKRRAKKWLIWSLGIIVLAIIFYLTNYHCVAVWIYLVLALSTLLFWRFINPKETKYPFIAGLLIILILSIIWLILECLYIWIIAIAVLIYLFVVDFLKRREKRE